jgi:chemotaxis protein histidine kinase CheA
VVEEEIPVEEPEPTQEEETTQEELPAVEEDTVDPVAVEEEEEEPETVDLLSANVEEDTEEVPVPDSSQEETTGEELPAEEEPVPAEEETPDQSETVEEEVPDQQEEVPTPDTSENVEEEEQPAIETAEEASSGHGHRWIKMEETYYTKDDDGNYNGGTVYVCLDCLDTSNEEPEDGEIVSVETISMKRNWYWAMTQDMDGNQFMGATLEEKTTSDTTPMDAVQEQYNKRYWVRPEAEFDGSCTEGGTVTYTATIRGQTDTKTETLAPGSHSYHSPAEEDFQWSKDYQTCQVHLVCTRGDSDTIEECPVVISQTAPTCTENGSTVYTASYTYASNSTVTSTRTVADGASALGHEYDENGRCIRCETLLKLDTPELTSVANSSAGVVLQWTKVAHAAGYRIYHKVNGKGSWVVLADLSGGDTTSYTDTDVQSGTLYTYAVRAYWGDLDEAVENTYHKPYWSSYDTAGLSITYLSIPTMSGLTATASGITVKWGKVTGATGYAVYRKAGSATRWTKVKTITSGSTVSWTDTDKITNGTKYTYTVRAYRKTNKGTVWGSYKATKTIYFVTCPTISGLTKGSKKFTVKWKKNAKATGYQIQYSTSKDFSNAKTVKITKNSTVSKTVSSLSKNKTYYVRIRAYKTVSGINYYSPWSGSKSVKTK